MNRIAASLIALACWGATSASATETDEVLPPGQTDTEQANLSALIKPSKRTRSQRREAAKDADGTTAPNRFEAETVIKSQYTLEGKTLEVDPD